MVCSRMRTSSGLGTLMGGGLADGVDVLVEAAAVLTGAAVRAALPASLLAALPASLLAALLASLLAVLLASLLAALPASLLAALPASLLAVLPASLLGIWDARLGGAEPLVERPSTSRSPRSVPWPVTLPNLMGRRRCSDAEAADDREDGVYAERVTRVVYEASSDGGSGVASAAAASAAAASAAAAPLSPRRRLPLSLIHI